MIEHAMLPIIHIVVADEGHGFDVSQANVIHNEEKPFGLLRIQERIRFMKGDVLITSKIGEGSKIDNLVMIGHNVRVGKDCVLVAQCGLSGSTILEDHVVIAGQAGLAGHLRVGKGSRVGAQAGVMADVPPRTEVQGSPAQPAREFFREVATLRRMVRASTKRGQAKGEADKDDTDKDETG